jgi:SAM-dependent methyltransferase
MTKGGKTGYYSNGKKKMPKVKPWYEDDKFWRTCAPVLFSERRRADAPGEVDQIVALLKLAPPARILDLCCGVARHSLELARRGFRVTGMDRTETYLEEARSQAAKEKLKLELIRSDMREFRRANTFDAVLNMFTSFGYFPDPNEDRRVAENVYQSLRRGGVFLIDVMGKEVLARVFRERDWHEEDSILVLEERKLSHNWSWIESHWTIITHNRRATFTVSHRLYSASELASLLGGCGFRKVQVHGGLDGTPYDQNARRLVAVARK